MGARAGKHAVSFYLWRQRRGLSGAFPIFGVLPDLGILRGCGADRDLSDVEDWDGRGQRSDCGSAGCVFHFVSASARADLVAAHILLSPASVDHAGILVCAAI